SVGVQLKAPVELLIEAPTGTMQEVTLRQLVVPLTRLKVSVLAGRSWSVAVAVKDRFVSSSTFLLPMAPSTGATLTSATVTVISSVSDSTGLPSRITLKYSH